MTRDDFVRTIQDHGYKKLVELGVAQGAFSTKLASTNPDELVLVDKWCDRTHETEAAGVRELFKGNKAVRIMHMLFSEAVLQFPDSYFDFVFIDGYAHTGQEGGQTLEQWWSKVRPGGFFGGHDYDPLYKPTMEAVDAFATRHKVGIRLTDESFLPSWWLIK